MAHTQEEAAELWCPFARPADSAGGRTYGWKRGGSSCIASECMAWRWLQAANLAPDSAIPRLGYCGLGGKP